MTRVAIEEPNPKYTKLEQQIQTTEDSIASIEKDISDLVRDPARRPELVEKYGVSAPEGGTEEELKEDPAAAEERAKVIAFLRKGCGQPTSDANRVISVFKRNKSIEEASEPVSTERVDYRKELLYKALILNMSTAADDYGSVKAAEPKMDFRVINYDFKFITQAGFVRHNQGYVLVCGIDGVWWAIQANIDGTGPAWESYVHPLVTKKTWDYAVEEYRKEKQGQAN